MTNPKNPLKAQRAKTAKLANARERTIAKQLLHTPTIPNLARAAYHLWNGIPYLGGQNEDGDIYFTGEVPVPGMRSAGNILKGTKIVSNGIKKLTPRYNAFAKYYGYNEVPNGASIEEAEKIIRQGLDQHNTFYRGITTPKKEVADVIKKKLGKGATDKDVMDYLARSGSRDPGNTYLSLDSRASQYSKNGDVAVIKRKYNLSNNPETWIDDADFVYSTNPATQIAPKGSVNYPWAGQYIEKAPPGEVRINPEDYTFEGWLPKTKWEFGTYVKPSEFKGSKNLYFNEAAGHIKPKFKQGGRIYLDEQKGI